MPQQAQIVEALRTATTALALESESAAFAGVVQERDLGAAVRATMRKERRQHGPS